MLLFQNNKTMDFSSFGFYIALASECDWDKRHAAYGCLKASNDELARMWHCSPSTIWRNKEGLKEIGLLFESETGYPRLGLFELFHPLVAKELAKLEFANSQDLIAQTQEKISNLHQIFANTQEDYVQKDPQSFNVSSKEDLGFFDREPGEERVASEPSEEDKAWMNSPAFEESVDKNALMNQVADEVFGNWKP